MFESSKFDKSGLKSGGHIWLGPDLAGFEKMAGAGYDIRCNVSIIALQLELLITN